MVSKWRGQILCNRTIDYCTISTVGSRHVTLSKMTHFTLVIQVTENQALVMLQSQKVMLPVSNFEIDVNS